MPHLILHGRPRRARSRTKRPGTLARLVVALAVAASFAVAPAADATTYQVQPAGSRVLAVTRRAGFLRALGHDHVIEGTRLAGSVTWAPDAPAEERTPRSLSGEVVIDAAALEIDAPAARRAAGLGEGPSGDDLDEIRRTFRGPKGLDTGRFGTIRLVLRRAEAAGDGEGGAVDPAAITRVVGDLTLHGQTRPITIPVTVGRSGATLLVRGQTEVRQTDFGIKPASVAGGLVKVKDTVEVSFVVLLAE